VVRVSVKLRTRTDGQRRFFKGVPGPTPRKRHCATHVFGRGQLVLNNEIIQGRSSNDTACGSVLHVRENRHGGGGGTGGLPLGW